jgi:GNAT superfamily N-acetyltransferase
VSDARIDELAETARNRGLRLVRSRVRTPGKRRFGKVGLTDPSGKPILGIDSKGPNASTEEVEDYLRNLGAKDWGASLDVAVMPRMKKPKKSDPAPRAAANDAEPEVKRRPVHKPARPAPPAPKEETKPKLREAKPSDSTRLAELIRLLGHEIGEKSVRKNLKALKKSGETPIVATLGKKIVGLVGVHRMATVHREAPVGRIPILIVEKCAQRSGIGRALTEAAEQWFRKQGCTMIEVTSNDRLSEAHAFYRHMGYERTGIRFFKKF